MYDLLTDAIDLAIQVLEGVSSEKWIPCSEKLPYKYSIYIVTISNDSVDFCVWNGKEFGIPGNGTWHTCKHVTAWMPLPECYRGQQNG